jgi:tRNA pseudouridine55 synthase
LLLDKPSGITSARAVAQVKRLLPKGTKIGHTGTLDPLASGLLVLLLGRATRLSRYVTNLDKSYTATARFGAYSTTLDADGVITLKEGPIPDEATLRAATSNFTGHILQTPPMASAVKVKGERLYKALRRGETVERESRPATVHALELIAYDPNACSATFEVSCGSGAYVRSLVADLAASLNTAAYITALRRYQVGHLTVQAAPSPEQLTPESLFNRIIPPKEVVAHLPVVEIAPALRRAVCSGRRQEEAFRGGVFRVELEGELLAIYRGDEDGGRPEVVLCDP